jgi:hypothetical protein
MGFGVLPGLVATAVPGFRGAWLELAGLRWGAVLTVSFAFGVDLGVLGESPGLSWQPGLKEFAPTVAAVRSEIYRGR